MKRYKYINFPQLDDLPFIVSELLIEWCHIIISESDADIEFGACISFTDPNFNPERPSYKPVDIYFDKDGYVDNIIVYDYIGKDPEYDLHEHSNFNFSTGCFSLQDRAFTLNEIIVPFNNWQKLFLRTLKRQVYKIEIYGCANNPHLPIEHSNNIQNSKILTLNKMEEIMYKGKLWLDYEDENEDAHYQANISRLIMRNDEIVFDFKGNHGDEGVFYGSCRAAKNNQEYFGNGEFKYPNGEVVKAKVNFKVEDDGNELFLSGIWHDEADKTALNLEAELVIFSE